MKSQTFLEFMNELRSKMLADIFCSSVFFIRLSLPIICINSFRKSWQRIVNPAISCPWWRNYLYRLLWRRFCCPGGSTQKVLILLRFWALLNLRTVFFPLAIRHWRGGVKEQQKRPWTISPFLFSLRKQEILPLSKIFSRPHVPPGGASGNALQLTSSSKNDEYTCLFSYAGQSFNMSATTERGSLLLTLIMRKSGDGSSASATLYSGTQTLGTVSFNFTSGTSSLKWDQSSIWTNTAKETFTNIKLATFNTEATDTDILNAFGLQVPEPATASLSLLGLAALMVRRRRKAWKPCPASS